MEKLSCQGQLAEASTKLGVRITGHRGRVLAATEREAWEREYEQLSLERSSSRGALPIIWRMFWWDMGPNYKLFVVVRKVAISHSYQNSYYIDDCIAQCRFLLYHYPWPSVLWLSFLWRP